MTDLAPSTINMYRVRLRKLLKVLAAPLTEEQFPPKEREMAIREVQELEAKLGPIHADLTPKRLGRPRKYAKIPIEEYNDLVAGSVVVDPKKDPSYWTPEAISARAAAAVAARTPQQSEDLLQQAIELAEKEKVKPPLGGAV